MRQRSEKQPAGRSAAQTAQTAQPIGAEVKNKGLWRKFFRLVAYAKVPWFGLVLYLGVNMFTVYVAVALPQVESDVFTGNASVSNIAFVIVIETISSLLVSVLLAAYGVIGGRIDRNFRNAIWDKILHLAPKYFDGTSPNTLLSRMTDDAESLKDFILLLVSEITGLTTTIATLAAMSSMNRGLAVMMAVFVPVFMVFGFIVGRIRMRVGNNVKFKMASLTDYLSGQLARIMVIKAYTREDYEQQRGEQAIRDYYAAQRKEQLVDFAQQCVATAINLVPEVLLLLVGVYMLDNGTLTPAGWIVFYAYALNILVFFSDKISLWINVKQYQGRMNRLIELFDAPEEGVKAYLDETVEPGDIAFEDVTFSYEAGAAGATEEPDEEGAEGRTVLEHVSCTFPKDQFTVVFGPSGTGKTTVVKLIERIYEPDEGRVLVGGRDLAETSIESWRRQVSYVMQEVPLISGSLRDNISYGVGRDLDDEQILAAAREVRADAFIASCPGGLDYDVGQFGNKLSGGQKQKVSVLRAFLQERPYVLLDEPTASLDPLATQDVAESIRSLAGKRTVVLVAHDGRFADMAQHVVVLEGDGAVYEGTAQEVARESAFFRRMTSGTQE